MEYDSRPWLRSYDPGIRADIEIEHKSLPDCLEEVRREFGSKPAIHFLGVTLTFEDLMGYADRFARCLMDHGLGKGDVVAIGLPNSPQYLIALIGAVKAGCAASGLSPLLTSAEMAHQLADSSAKAFVVMDALFEHRLTSIAEGLGDLQVVFPTGLLDFLPRYKQILARWLKKVPTGAITSLSGKEVHPFLERISDFPPDPPTVDISLDQPCFLQYTGGTTGVPKGAVCLHSNILANVTQFHEWLRIDRGADTLLSAYPMFHIAGLFTATVGLAFGLTQVLIPNPRDTGHIVKEIARYRPQWLANVPSLYPHAPERPGIQEA